jgi:hypothetical protein
MSLGSGRCFSHPDRAGLGICVECRHVICIECTTQFEGINRCSACLAKRLESVRRIATRSEWSFGSVALAVLSMAALFALFASVAGVLAH